MWSSGLRTLEVRSNVLPPEAALSIVTPESLALQCNEQFRNLVDLVDQAAGTGERIDRVERNVFEHLLSVGHTLLKKFVVQQGTADVGEVIEQGERCFKRLDDLHERRYVSIFGELMIERTAYGTRETRKIEVAPLDERLALPGGEFSYVLEDWLQRMCIKDSFAESVESLHALLGIKPSVRSAEGMNQRMAEHGEAFRDDQLAIPADDEGQILVFTADGKGVVMRKPDQPVRDATGPACSSPMVAGESQRVEETKSRKGKRRMAYIGATYSIDPFVRTAEDVIDELRRRHRQKDRPSPLGKRLWAEMSRVIEGESCRGRTALFDEMADEISLRNPDGRKVVVCLMDGERALWDAKEDFLKDGVGILDLFHVLERLHAVAGVFHKKGSSDSERFVTDRLRMLLEGKVGRIIGGFRQMATKHRLKGEARKTVQSAITYYENNRKHMQYDQYLAAGYPIGSGVAEGACRHLVKDRMERTGMRWRQTNAQAMLHLRAIHLNGDWDEFIEHRVRHEQKCLYALAL